MDLRYLRAGLKPYQVLEFVYNAAVLIRYEVLGLFLEKTPTPNYNWSMERNSGSYQLNNQG